MGLFYGKRSIFYREWFDYYFSNVNICIYKVNTSV